MKDKYEFPDREIIDAANQYYESHQESFNQRIAFITGAMWYKKHGTKNEPEPTSQTGQDSRKRTRKVQTKKPIRDKKV